MPAEIQTVVWKGQKRYLCPLLWESGAACEYDSYELSQLRDHMKAPHTASGKAPEVQQARVSMLFDHEGKQIIHQPIEEREAPIGFSIPAFKL
jgi:hypothetical protein